MYLQYLCIPVHRGLIRHQPGVRIDEVAKNVILIKNIQ